MKTDLFQTSAVIIPDPEMEEFSWTFQVPPISKIRNTLQQMNFGGGLIFNKLRFHSGFLADVEHTFGFAIYRNQSNIHIVLPKRHGNYKFIPQDVMLQLVSESKVKVTHTLKVIHDDQASALVSTWPAYWKHDDGTWDDTINSIRLTFRIIRESTGLCQQNLIPYKEEVRCKKMISAAKEVDCKEFLLSEDLSDVVIACKGRNYPAHRILLSSRSSVFNRMFRVSMKEVQEGRVVIEDMEPDVLQELLRFMYTGDVSSSIDEICVELFQAAHKYDVEALKVICEVAMLTKVNAENALEMYMMAEVHDAKSLKYKALEEVRLHKKSVFHDIDTYRVFASRYPDLAFQLLALG